jgi:hypothetical protein
MPQLHEVQQAFRAAVLGQDTAVAQHIVSDGIDAAERVRIYRNTARSVLTEALRLTYPALDRLVGAEFFDAAAAAFIARHPPAHAYLTLYGGAFADFLASFPEAAALSYLPDVARFEWALNLAANAADAPALSPATLASVDPTEHGQVCFVPHPSLTLLRLDHPADTIADAVLARDEAAMAAIDLADGPIWLVVHRGPDGVDAQRLTEIEWRLTRQLCAQKPLGPVLDRSPAPGATALLASHLIKGRFVGFHMKRSTKEVSR